MRSGLLCVVEGDSLNKKGETGHRSSFDKDFGSRRKRQIYILLLGMSRYLLMYVCERMGYGIGIFLIGDGCDSCTQAGEDFLMILLNTVPF